MAIQSEISLANINGPGSRHPGNANRADALSDLEFQELLEELTVRINADNLAFESGPGPGSELKTYGPAQSAPLRASRVQPPPERHQGISTNITATIISLALAAGFGWLLYTNPGLLG